MNKLKNELENLIEDQLNTLFITYPSVDCFIQSTYIDIVPYSILDKDFKRLTRYIRKLFKIDNTKYEIIHLSHASKFIRIYEYDISYFEKMVIFK